MSNEGTQRLKPINRIAYGLGKGGGSVFDAVASSFLLSYYTDTALIGAGAIATMFIVCRIFDGISDFAMGAIVDRTRTKLGKARPWLLASAPLMLIGIILQLNVPEGASDGAKLAYAYITYIFMNVIVYTIFGIAHTAMIPLMTKNPEEHTLLSLFSAMGNGIVAIITGAAVVPLVMNMGWHTTSIILGIISCVLILSCALINKEQNAGEDGKPQEALPLREQMPAVLKNKYFYLVLLIGVFSLIVNSNVTAAQVYFCNIVLGQPEFMSILVILGQLPGFISVLLMPMIVKRSSKRTFLCMGSISLIIGFMIAGLAGANTTLIVVGAIFRGLGIVPMFSAIYALIPDVVDYGAWKFGTRSEGLISSAQSIGSKIGIGVGSAMTGWFLAAVHYDATAAVQPEAVVSAVRFDYTWFGAIMSVILLIIVWLTDVEKFAGEYRKAA